MPPTPDDLLNKILSKGGAPSLSPLAVRLVELASDDNASPSDLAAVIEKSPGLTSRLLSLVNSAAYSRGGGEISSVTRAVLLLGLREVRVMALSISLRDTLPVSKSGPDYQLFWRASLHRAALARQGAVQTGLDLAEEAFVGGLLLELGLPLLLNALDEELRQEHPGMGGSLAGQLSWEKERLGVDHRELGAKVLKDWGLPANLIACQQILDIQTMAKADPLVKICGFARRATEAFFLPGGRLDEINALAEDWFGLDAKEVGELLASAIAFVGEAAQALEIELDHGADLLEVMEKANAALSRLAGQMKPALQEAALAPTEEASPNGEDDAVKIQEKAMVNAMEALAHEIRNPLMGVGGFARRLAKQIQNDERAQKYASMIVDQAARLDGVLAEMTSLLEPYSPNLAKAELNRLLTELARNSKDQNIELHLPTERIEFKSDAKALSAALGHILNYGRHLARPKEAKLHLRLEASAKGAQVQVLGPGGLNSGKDDALAGKSFGPELGLAKARRIVEALGGGVGLKPWPKGEGFQIKVYLPFELKE